jgi:hypothetical protein
MWIDLAKYWRYGRGTHTGQTLWKKVVAPLEAHKWVVSLAPLEGAGWVASMEVACV